ncbi:MAG: hypothetical protein DWQ07_19160 [Chloroflexi bacterium]|nr:MAG: hypothetical protein DWQ07_19160 [Chloroflexota bacterium]MBL1195053.1 hypothetical protein [Chloroflexota bacterium]NOH12341.1 hypothetical protein [Chloroflexota bacterium]
MRTLTPFSILAPTTLQDSFQHIEEHGWNAALYAGGTELLLTMRSGLASFPYLIDIKKIPQFDEISFNKDEGMLTIGAGATHRSIETSPLVLEQLPLLAEVESMVANIRVRTVGTIGGNLCFADPHSDPATLFMAWAGTTFELVSSAGVRQIAPDEFFVDLFTTARAENELMSKIHLPILGKRMGGAYKKFVTLERPTANVAAFLGLANGKIDSARIAVGSVGPIPVRAIDAEGTLLGGFPDEKLFERAAETAAEATDPVDDVYGSKEYKKQIVRVLTRRALKQAATRADRSQ